MGSFVKGWIWIWLFSNTLSLGLSLLWELASRTYRQPTKGYTAGKVIPKADLWTIRHRPIDSLVSERDWKLDRFNRGPKRHVCARAHSRRIVFASSHVETKEFSVEASSNLVSIRYPDSHPDACLFIQSLIITVPDRDRPTVNALLKLTV